MSEVHQQIFYYLTVKIRYSWDKAHHDLLSQADNPRWYCSNQQEKSVIPEEFRSCATHIWSKSAANIPVISPFLPDSYCSLPLVHAVLSSISTKSPRYIWYKVILTITQNMSNI